MSKEQYDLTKQTTYLDNKMFLDPAGPVTIQRFEEVKYDQIANFEETARGFFWIPEEISLTKDAGDFKDASDAVKHIFTANLLRQTALDSLQGRGPVQVFTPVVSLPELEALMYNWSFFETNIHSRSYSHIIRNIYNVPKDIFDTIHDTKEIADMASSVCDYYDGLHAINCQKEMGKKVDEETHIKAIWMALHASYALEALRFIPSKIFAYFINSTICGSSESRTHFNSDTSRSALSRVNTFPNFEGIHFVILLTVLIGILRTLATSRKTAFDDSLLNVTICATEFSP